MNELILINGAPTALTAKAHEVMAGAEAADVTIRFLGYQCLFRGVRAYSGPHHDWVVASAADDPQIRRGELAIPKAELSVLRRLLDAGLDCQAVYLAHEIPKGRLALSSPTHMLESAVPVEIDPVIAERVVDKVPIPPRTATLARHLGNTAGVFLAVLAAARPIGRGARWTGRTVAAAGLSAAATAVQGLDPIIFGAWTAGKEPDPGVPAAFFELVSFMY
jgi:hypothetical protein